MWINAVSLTVLALLLAGPLSQALARALWPRRNPRTALLLWQAIGLAGGVALLFTGLSLAEMGLPQHSLHAFTSIPAHLSALNWIGWMGCIITLFIAGWLLGVTARTGRAFAHTLRRNRQILQLLGESIPWPSETAKSRRPLGRTLRSTLTQHQRTRSSKRTETVHILPFSIPSAYCIGGVRPKIVLTAAALAALNTEQLSAIVAHEQAHARYHHDLVIQPFVAWHRAFPFLNPSLEALTAVETLVELHADDSARKKVGLSALIAAIRSVQHLQSEPSTIALPSSNQEVTLRIQHLQDTTVPLNPFVQACILLTALVVALLPILVLLAH